MWGSIYFIFYFFYGTWGSFFLGIWGSYLVGSFYFVSFLFLILSLAYLQYFFNWTCYFVLNVQWQVVVGFNYFV